MRQPGTKLEGYLLLRTVGQGGMGAVYLAQNEKGQNVAIKEMVVDIREPEERRKAVEQFATEAALLRSLHHPLLVDIHETFAVGDAHYMVMDYVEGKTLTELLEEREALPSIDEVLDWAGQLCEVLGYLHTREPAVIFRDLKPSNVMLDTTGKIRLIDFGIARSFVDETKTRTFIKGVGSKGFAPIEQYGAGGTDERTDIYSLGATLYNLLTGTKPPASVSILAATDHLEPLRKYNPAVPRSLEQLVLNMMALQKDNRYSSIEEVQKLLARVRQEDSGDDFTDELTGALLDDEWDGLDIEDEFRPQGVQAVHPVGHPTLDDGRGTTTNLLSPQHEGIRIRPIHLLLFLLILGAGLAGAKYFGLFSQPAPNIRPGIEADSIPPLAKRRGGNEWKVLVGAEPWRYLANGSNQGTAWKEPDFDDRQWSEGIPELGYGEQDEATILGFGGDPKNKFTTAYFRRSFEVDDLDDLEEGILGLRILRDDGAIVYLNGKEFFRTNMAAGPVDYKTMALTVCSEPDETRYFEAGIPTSMLQPGKNVLAVEIHQCNLISSDLSFNLIIDAHSATQWIPLGSTWKYLDDGSNQGQDWYYPTFDDSQWKSGKAKLGYGVDGLQTALSFGQHPNAKFITTYFRKAFEAKNVLNRDGLRLMLRRDDGAVVYLNGREVYRTDMAPGLVGPRTLATTIAVESNYETVWLNPRLLQEGANVIAVEIHQVTPESPGISFDLQLVSTP
jgi:serine/threonine protein kinase